MTDEKSARAQSQFAAQFTGIRQQLIEEQNALTALNSNLMEQLAANGATEVVIQENARIQRKNASLVNELELTTTQFVETTVSFNQAKLDLALANSNYSDLLEAFGRERSAREAAESSLAVANNNYQASFEIKDLSEYLTDIINAFNEKVNTGDGNVNYIIKELDLELKTYISKTENSELRMSPPDLSTNSDEALSRIRFTIGAVPKDITPE